MRWWWLFLLVLLLVIVVGVVWRPVEYYEIAKNQDYRLLYYTEEAHYFSLKKLSFQTLVQQYPHEFSMDNLHYYTLDFDQCTTLYHQRKSLPFPASYVEDLYDMWKTLEDRYRQKERRLVWYPRDRVERFDFPVLVKSRILLGEERGSILFKLNTIRHYHRMHRVVEQRSKEPSFAEKIPQLVWRGAPTGYGFENNIPFRSVSRETLLEKYAFSTSPWINVGMVNKKEGHYQAYKKYEKEELSLSTLLQYKYLLSVEGNDVATNLKWILASNSLVVMPKPQITSWLMEDALLPYVHYLPVRDDFSDLETQIEWAEKHGKKCEKMIIHAHRFIEPFLDQSREKKLQASVLRYYLDHFSWSP